VSLPLFDSFLSTAAMSQAFGDAAIVQGMLDFEAALAQAQAAEGLIPAASVSAIRDACRVEHYDLQTLAEGSRTAGTLAIPLVQALKRQVAQTDPPAAEHVHWGSTSQDVIDTGLVLATRAALAVLDGTLAQLLQALLPLAQQHLRTPVLARTLMQPAQVTALGLKFAQWAAPLVRSRHRLRETAAQALALQLGGAVGTLAAMGEPGTAVAARMAVQLRLRGPVAPWHTQRDDWVRLGLEAAVLTGSLGKIATDLSLMAQAELGELAEPSAPGRGGSTAMAHKRNPVSCMVALAAALRAPQQAAALLAAMPQQHERGLGHWQAELAEWPGLFIGAHAAAHAMADAMAGLQITPGHMRRNIDALRGTVFTEPGFDADAAVAPAAAMGERLLKSLQAELDALPPAPWAA
jgi:3-carboxy-cis,cis-muconate cycloisomerase